MKQLSCICQKACFQWIETVRAEFTILASKPTIICPSRIQKSQSPKQDGGPTKIIPSQWILDRDWHWTRTVMLCGLFIGVGAIAFFGGQTLISKTALWRLIVLCMLAGFAIPYRLYNRWLGINKLEMAMFCVFGIGLCSSALILSLNLLIPAHTERVRYAIVNREMKWYAYPEELIVTCGLEDHALSEFPVFRRFSMEDPDGRDVMHAVAIEYTVSEGLFGMKTIRKQELIQ